MKKYICSVFGFLFVLEEIPWVSKQARARHSNYTISKTYLNLIKSPNGKS